MSFKVKKTNYLDPYKIHTARFDDEKKLFFTFQQREATKKKLSQRLQNIVKNKMIKVKSDRTTL